MAQPETALQRARRTLAAGGNPQHEQTFEHPKHGPLVFRWRLPLAADSLQHSIALDNELGSLNGEPSTQTMLLAAALAGMTPPEGAAPGKGLLLELPQLGEPEVKDNPDGSQTVIQRYYDPRTEHDLGFLTDVWVAFSAWRGKLLSDDTVRAVGESSGDPSTSSDASSTPSDSATGSPLPTPAS